MKPTTIFRLRSIMCVWICLFTLFSATETLSQSPDFSWANNAGGPTWGRANSIATDPSGSSYVSGYFGGTITNGATQYPSQGYEDMALIKYDIHGATVRVITIGGSSSDVGIGNAIDAQGNMFLAGSYNSTDMIVGGSPVPNSGESDVLLIKFDSSGNVLWSSNGGGTGNDFSSSVAVDAAGNSYLVGTFYSPSITFGSTTLTQNGSGDIFIVKYDPTGNLQWAYNVGGADADFGNQVKVDGSGNIYVAGGFKSSTITFGSTTLTKSGNGSMYVVKYDGAGNVLWATSASGANESGTNALAVDASGNTYVTGFFSGSTVTFGSQNITANDGWHMYVVKYDPNGNAMWAKTSGPNNYDEGRGVAVDSAGHCRVLGWFYDQPITIDTTTLTSHGADDFYVLNYDENGNIIWSTGGGGSSSDVSFGIAVDPYGNSLMVGETQSPTVTLGSVTLTNTSSDDWFIAKLGAAAPYTLTVNATNGSVTKNPDQSTFSSGSLVQLTATPDAGYQFVQWSGDASGSTNPITITMDANKTLTANFALTCIAPDLPTLSAVSTTICNGSNTTLSISNGNLNSATNWKWYSGSCGGTFVGTGQSIVVSPTVTTTYYARGEGGCVTPGSCGSITITVTPTVAPSVSIVASPSSNGAAITSTTENNRVVWDNRLNRQNYVGQSFTTGSSPFTLSSITVKLYTTYAGDANGGSLRISVYQDDGTTLNGKSPIATSQTATYDVAFTNPNEGRLNTRLFTGANAITLSPNTAYTFVLYTTGQNFFAVASNNTHPYTGGVGVQATGGVFSAVPGFDLYFTINGSEVICAGTNVTFTATPTNGGITPSYQWKKNGSNVGTNSATYSASGFSTNDVISCVLTSNATCASPSTATSNSLTMTVTPAVTPSVSIGVSPSGVICSGTTATFTATPTNGGSSPRYQWKKNGNNVGTNSATYSDNGLANNDVISCEMTSNASCPSPSTATSNNITMTVSPTVTPAVSISANFSGQISPGTVVTFTATPTNGGSTPAYQWKKNGINVGMNMATYVDSTLTNNDSVACGMVSNATCASPSSVTSNSITVFLKYSLTVNSSNGSVTRNPNQDYYDNGTVVELTATPLTGYHFVNWSDGVSDTSNPVTVSMTGNRSVTANFDINQYTVSFDANGGIGSMSNQTANYNASTPLTDNNFEKIGYSFIGWNLVANDTGVNYVNGANYNFTSNITLYAKWSANNYTISFNSNGGSEVTAMTQAYGTTVTAPANPTKTGYTFEGWYSDSGLTTPYTFSTMGLDITLYTKWSANNYTISFNSNGGSEVTAITQAYGTTVTAPANPTKTGYTFDSWYSESGLTTPYTFSTMGLDITLYAKWSANSYTITFNSNGGSDVTALTQAYGTTVTAPADPTKTGYTFEGWYSDSGLTTPYTFSIMGLDITLYAKWSANSYTITFNSNGGSNITAITQAYGTTVTAPANPTKTGYTFEGWYSDSGLTTPNTFSTMGLDITLYAKWSANSYTITFNSNGGSEVTAITQAYGTTVTAPANPTKTGYTFDSWYSDSGLTTPYTFSTMGLDITLYAKWSANNYTITFNSNDGSEVTAITQAYGTTVTAPANPMKTGYTFDGWYSESGLTTPYTFSTMGLDITLYAKWSANSYTITFNSNGGSEGTAITQAYGTTVTAPANPTKMGYTFSGWYSDSGLTAPYTFSTMGLDITLYAKWTINTYTITSSAVGNGTITPVGEVSVQYGQSQSYTFAPGSDSHLDSLTVDGVYVDSTVSYTFTSVASDHLIIAYFSVNQYLLRTSASNGAIARSPNADYYTHGSQVQLIATPNANFVFAGWSGDTTGSVIKNDTLTVTMDSSKSINATFRLVQYTITVTQGTNGIIAPGTTSVNHGAQQTFTITPATDYVVDKVLVDGNNVGSVLTYTFNNVTTNHTISVEYKLGPPRPSLVLTYPTGGEVWKVGETVNITWTTVNIESVNVRLDYYNSTWPYEIVMLGVAQGISGNYAWTIPSSLADKYINTPLRVTITGYNGTVPVAKTSTLKNGRSIIQRLVQQPVTSTKKRLNDVAFFGATGYIVGDSGTFLKTTNSGVSWTKQRNPIDRDIKAIHGFSTDNLRILSNLGGSALITSSINGGRDWRHYQSVTQMKGNDITFINGLGDILVGDSGKIVSPPLPFGVGRETITPTPAPPNVKYYSIMYAGDSLFGPKGKIPSGHPILYVVGANGTILRLKWAGQLYLGQLPSGVTTDLKGCSFINKDTGWVVGNGGTILKTTNAGRSWLSQVSGTTLNLNGIAVWKDAQKGSISGWIVGDGGTIFKYTAPTAKAKWRAVTQDVNEWTKVEGGIDDDLTVAAVTSNGSFVAAGDSGTAITTPAGTLVLTSATGGGSYIAGQTLPITWASDGVNNVKIEYSPDSGQTWNTVNDLVSASSGSYDWTTPNTPLSYVLIAVTDIEDSTVSSTSNSTFSLTTDLTMFRTFKADTSLSKKAVALKFNENNILTSGNGNMRTVTENVFLRLKTTKQAIILGKPQADKTLKKKVGWIALSSATQFGKMFTAPHTGTSYPIDSVRLSKPWKAKKLVGVLKPTRKAYNNPAWEQGIIFKMNLMASQKGITPAGFGDLVLDTTVVLNGLQLKGMTLSEIGNWMDSVMTWWDILGYSNGEAYKELEGFAALLKNINEAFYDTLTVSNSYIDTVAVVKGDSKLSRSQTKPKNRYAMYLRGVKSASQSGGLVKYVQTNSSTNDVVRIQQENQPEEFRLNQNYPNPFNPTTSVSFVLSQSSMVTLKVYNIIGQEVATLLNNEAMENGEHEVVLNATNFASGVYFYRINVVGNDGVTSFVDVKKMLLVK